MTVTTGFTAMRHHASRLSARLIRIAGMLAALALGLSAGALVAGSPQNAQPRDNRPLPATGNDAPQTQPAPDENAPAPPEDRPPAPPKSPTPDPLAGLPDFSWAGYHAGEKSIPRRAPTVSVTEFGAKPDGVSDCTAAFQQALTKVQAAPMGGVLKIPAGRWRLTGTLDIRASNVVIQGAGADKTLLICPKSLTDIHGPSKGWSWGGGMIRAQARGRTQTLGTVATPLAAGATVLPIAFAEKAVRPRVGEWLHLSWFNDRGDDTLLDWLYGGVVPRAQMGAELRKSSGARVIEWVRVAKVSAAGITITQPLRLPCRPAWRVTLARKPHLREVGVEGLSLVFPKTRYLGHLKEKGYNGIWMNAVVNGWVRDVRIENADSGIFVNGSKYVTVSGIDVRGRYMHHVLSASWSADCLITRWRIEAPHRHGTTISWAAHGNVFSHGRGRELAMDAHRAASFANLHSAVTIVHGARVRNVFRSGGSWPRGPHTARSNVYWNIEHQFPPGEGAVRFGPVREWPLAVFAGWRGNRPIEFLRQPGLKQRVLALNAAPPVPELRAAQLARRLAARAQRNQRQTPPPR